MTRGELAPTEPHPAAYTAKEWIAKLPTNELFQWREAFASCAIEGNRLAEVCSETLRRLMDGKPVGDRYILGLSYTMRSGNWPETDKRKKTRKLDKLKQDPSFAFKRKGLLPV